MPDVVAKGNRCNSAYLTVLTLCEPQAEAGDKANQVLTLLPTRRAQFSAVDRHAAVASKGSVFGVLWALGGRGMCTFNGP